MGLGDYLLFQFINGLNVELDAVSRDELELIESYGEEVLLFTPITDFKMSYELYDRLCAKYANQPLLNAALKQLRSKSNLRFIGAKNAN